MPRGIPKNPKVTKEKMRLRMLGNKINLGRKPSLGTRRKMSISHIGKRINEQNPGWKGEKITYFTLHSWIRKKLGKAQKCINGHIAKIYYWCNKSGNYTRNFSDWHELCPSCNKLDGVKIHSRYKII